MKLFKSYYVFSPALRIWHWVNFVAIIVLFVTGLYVGNPFFSGPHGKEATFATTMAFIRFLHFSAGYVLLAAFLFRIATAPFNKGDRLVIPAFWREEFWHGLKETLKEYLLFKEHEPMIRNPLARTAYFFFYLLLVFMLLTGFGIYGLSNPGGFWDTLAGWVVWSLGGEFQAKAWHHWVAWIIVLFFVVHLYLVVREDALRKNGEVSSMVNGVKFFDEDPVDLEDVKEEER